MTPSVTAKNTSGSLTASANTFQSTHVGALFKLTQPRVNVTETVTKTGTDTGVSSAAGINVKGNFKFTTAGGWYGTAILERMEDGVNWETFRTIVSSASPGANIQWSGTEEADNVYYRINLSAHTSGEFTGTITVDESTQSGIVRIDSYTSATVVSITVLVVLASTDATKRWYEGAWSEHRGYPRTMTFFEERAVYGGSTYETQTIWLSESADYENFENGVKAADSFSLTLPSTDSIRWMESLEALVIGTSGGEWRIRATSLDEALTPTNFNIRQQTAYGGAAIQGIKVNEAVLFVDFPTRKIREMIFVDSRQKFEAPDLTVLAEQITDSGIVGVAYQKNPDSILWGHLTDGTLVSMTYEKSQNTIAWSVHPVGGSGLVKSSAVIPSTSEDEVWFIVERTINGSTVRYIEQMQPRSWGSSDEDCFFVDSGLTYSGVATTTITGLSHLEGETVKIFGNGSVLASEVVSSGSIIVDESVTKAIVGLPFTYKLEPMRLDAYSGADTTRGEKRKITEVAVSFLSTSGAKYGKDASNLYDFNWRTEEAYGSPPALFTGDKIVVFDGGFSEEDTILITGSDPLPCTVRAIIAKIEVSR